MKCKPQIRAILRNSVEPQWLKPQTDIEVIVLFCRQNFQNIFVWRWKGFSLVKGNTFNSLPTEYFFMFVFLSSADFFKNQLFQKILSGTSSEYQTVWIQIGPDILSGLILFQTVCKSYQQTTLVGKELGHSVLLFFRGSKP